MIVFLMRVRTPLFLTLANVFFVVVVSVWIAAWQGGQGQEEQQRWAWKERGQGQEEEREQGQEEEQRWAEMEQGQEREREQGQGLSVLPDEVFSAA
jgi:flagellar biosynthesis component FlhA